MLMDLLYSYAQEIQPPIDAVIGIDSRGFLFGPMVALHLNIPFVPVRKKGKLPGPTKKVAYDLEYGQASYKFLICLK
jgi:adenine phosphoribosyltransferase